MKYLTIALCLLAFPAVTPAQSQEDDPFGDPLVYGPLVSDILLRFKIEEIEGRITALEARDALHGEEFASLAQQLALIQARLDALEASNIDAQTAIAEVMARVEALEGAEPVPEPTPEPTPEPEPEPTPEPEPEPTPEPTPPPSCDPIPFGDIQGLADCRLMVRYSDPGPRAPDHAFYSCMMPMVFSGANHYQCRRMRNYGWAIRWHLRKDPQDLENLLAAGAYGPHYDFSSFFHPYGPVTEETRDLLASYMRDPDPTHSNDPEALKALAWTWLTNSHFFLDVAHAGDPWWEAFLVTGDASHLQHLARFWKEYWPNIEGSDGSRRFYMYQERAWGRWIKFGARLMWAVDHGYLEDDFNIHANMNLILADATNREMNSAIPRRQNFRYLHPELRGDLSAEAFWSGWLQTIIAHGLNELVMLGYEEWRPLAEWQAESLLRMCGVRYPEKGWPYKACGMYTLGTQGTKWGPDAYEDFDNLDWDRAQPFKDCVMPDYEAAPDNELFLPPYRHPNCTTPVGSPMAGYAGSVRFAAEAHCRLGIGGPEMCALADRLYNDLFVRRVQANFTPGWGSALYPCTREGRSPDATCPPQ